MKTSLSMLILISGLVLAPLSAQARVRAELEFIGYVEHLYRATQGGGHAE